MLNKKNLFKISGVLITVNLLLMGFLFSNHLSTEKQIREIRETTPTQVLGAGSIPRFDPNDLMSNETFASTRAFPTQASVQNYLDSRNSVLRNYREQGQLASYWIFSAARGITSSKHGVSPRINPGVLIAYLEKEQSLISLSSYDTVSDPHNRIRTAMGYGCPDGTNCEERFFGLANQLNWGAYQLQFNFDRAQTGSPLVFPYHINRTITTLDEHNVFLTNAATAANYRYTPHVYWGNYNLWKIITANGWGVSSATYSMAEIDRVNLVNKDENIGFVDVGEIITLEEIKPILRQTFSYGQTGENIKKLQRFLRQRGYFMNRQITGMYGLVTEQAHKSFNRDHGILNAELTDRCKDLFNRNWQAGQQGQEVRDLQICLRDAGYFDWPIITGYYGGVTRSGLESIRRVLTGDVKELEEIVPEIPVNIPTASGKVRTVSKGVNVAGLNLRNSICGDRLAVINWGTEGEKISGPVNRNCLGGNWNWYQVRFANQTGWVVDYYLEEIKKSEVEIQPSPVLQPEREEEKEKPSQPSPDRVRAFANGHSAPDLNFRSSPCGDRIGSIQWGQTGEKLGENKNQSCFGRAWNWQKVRFNGQTGWVADFYLQDLSERDSVKTNSRGENVAGLNIRNSACGTRIGIAGWGETGVKLQGPVRRTCFGRTWNWYEVEFNGQTGWVVDHYLE